ncbi:MAG: hypothetical protein K2I59_06560, partial [Alistipes sp.]|nr:hypothetical protein [Alistipes sp.]
MRKITSLATLLALGLSLAAQGLCARDLAPTVETADAADTLAVRQPTINELRRERGLTDTHNTFVPKGQWIFGGTA